ncbi:MAG: hypothetical protein GY696_08640 [Gammaproteobacteria bacterium]|nr:hypothetical protein [Gammaproteobacteria bacterium]
MEKLAAYIAAKDTTMDKESPDNDFSDKDYMSDEDYIAHKDKFVDTENPESDHMDKEFSDKEHSDKENSDKDNIADEDIEAKDNIMAKENIMDKGKITAKDDIAAKVNRTVITSHPCVDDIMRGNKDKEESHVSPADTSGSGCLLSQDPADVFDFPANKDVVLSSHGQDCAASSHCSQG